MSLKRPSGLRYFTRGGSSRKFFFSGMRQLGAQLTSDLSSLQEVHSCIHSLLTSQKVTEWNLAKTKANSKLQELQMFKARSQTRIKILQAEVALFQAQEPIDVQHLALRNKEVEAQVTPNL
jgi:hypothetical protein